jgi:hypothetical protein
MVAPIPHLSFGQRPTIDESPEAFTPTFWQRPFAQNVMPLCTSLMLHIAVIIVGVATYHAVRIVRATVRDQVVVPTIDPSMMIQPSAVIPSFSTGMPEARQDQYLDAKELAGFSAARAKDLSAALARGAGGRDDGASGEIALGPNPLLSGRGSGHGSGPGADGGPPALFGAPRGTYGGLGPGSSVFPSPNAKRIVFVLDATGSMMASFDALRMQLRKAVQNLQVSQSFDILFINEHDPAPLAPALLYATPENKRKAIEYADTMAPRGATNPLPALKRAFALRPQLIYFLIDPTDFPDRAAVLDLVRAQAGDGRVKLNIIAFEGHDAENERFLNELAGATGGVYRFVTADELGAE